ncbi:MAG TPA: DUF4412 domain-containing protein [Verrucomicrobiae bacterium]|jgi:hypothetical protein|nr:DUF4412 domain-containing protein [Verrucomicrobiae bacterium]
MKSFNFLGRVSGAGLLALLIGSATVFGQVPSTADKSAAGPGSAPGMNAAMIRFFGSNTNFISKAEVRVLDKNQKETTAMNMGFQMLAGKMRVDINMAEVKSKEMSPEFAGMMKQMGMDQMSTILLPEQKEIITIYPGLKSYALTPMPKEEADAAAMTYKLEKSRIGKETVDGHSCEKDNVTVTDTKGNQQHAVVWYATDLKEFPVQMQIPDDDSTLIMKFKDVKLGRPETSQFQAPAGLAKYDDVAALMSDAVTKKMGMAPK